MLHKLDTIVLSGDDCSSIKIIDNSIINPTYPITNGILEITPPGFTCPVIFNVVPGFSLTMNVNSLNLSTISIDNVVYLPDGAYKIGYSINPNKQTYIEKYYFQNCKLMTKYRVKAVDLMNKRITFTKKELSGYVERLQWITDLIDGAKFYAQDCGDLVKSASLYNEANDLLTALTYDKRC